MALMLAISMRTQMVYESTTIYTDHQAAIRSTRKPGNQSGQFIPVRIAQELSNLHNLGVEVEIRWVPAHQGSQGNQMADVNEKEATGWREIYQDNKRIEIDTGDIAPVPPVFNHLRTAIKAKQCSQLLNERDKVWKEGTTGRTLFSLTGSPSKKTLTLHQNLPRPLNSVLIQMQTGKIGLRHFLHSRGVPGVEDDTCLCGQGPQKVEHALLSCRRHSTLRPHTWTDEIGRRTFTDTSFILNIPALATKTARFMVQTRLLGLFGAVSIDNSTWRRLVGDA